MTDLKVSNQAGNSYSASSYLASLDNDAPQVNKSADQGELIAQKPPGEKKPPKWVEDYIKSKTSNPNNLANYFGMNSEQSVKVLAEIGISTDIGYLKPLDRIAWVTGLSSPASLGGNWEQKTGFLTGWVRAGTNDIAVSTQGIQIVTQLRQQGAITANEARLRIAGYTLKAQTASQKINIVSYELGRAGLTTSVAEGKQALARLQLQYQQIQATIRPALQTASINLDTINKTVRNQSAGVKNTAVNNLQQLDNLRQRALDLSRAVSPVPRSTSTNPRSTALESDPKSGVPLPEIPTYDIGILSKSRTKDLFQAVLPITKNGRPPELASSPTPGAGIAVPDVTRTAAQEQDKLKTAAFDLKKFANLTDQQFKAKFGATRAAVQREFDAIKANKPVAIDVRELQAAPPPSAEKIDWNQELKDAKFYANQATDLRPDIKAFINNMDVKTMAHYESMIGLAASGAGIDAAKLVGTGDSWIKSLKAGRGIINGGETPKSGAAASGKKFADSLAKYFPSASLTELNNLYGQLARNKNYKETIRSHMVALQSEKLASKGLVLANQSYQQGVVALNQGAAQNKVTVEALQTNFKNVQSQMSALQLRNANLGIGDKQLGLAQQSLKATAMIGDVSIATAQANNKIAAQSGRITAATGLNNTFTNNLNRVVSAGQDHNVEQLRLFVREAPPAVVMTSAGLVVPTRILNESLLAVRAKTGASNGAVRYDSPAVLKLAQQRTHQEFAAAPGNKDAAAVLLAKTPNSVGMASASILREGKYDAARKLAPVNLNATPSASYRYQYLPPQIVWGKAVPPVQVTAEPIPIPSFRPDGTTKAQENTSLNGSPNRENSNVEPTRRAP